MVSTALLSDTIVAIATPPGEGGVGILRLSGSQAPEILAKMFQGHAAPERFESHKLYHGKFLCPVSKEILDRGLAVWMKAPHSYTGEEVVELQAHGGPLLLHRILNVLVREGARPAAPGEFTRRAFLNGKLDLLQAEAVGETIRAKSEAALKNAQAQLEGRLSREIQGLRETLLTLLARVEAAIDFPEEDIELIAPAEMRREIDELTQTLQVWREKFHIGRLLREGVRVALVGRPNVGKSSLLNRLLGEDKAIVHDSPGTTRDVIEGWLQWEGFGFQFFDTAGIREAKGEVEQEGIRRSLQAAARADLTLWVLDVSAPLTEEDLRIGRQLSTPTLVVGNKTDRGLKSQNFPEGTAFPVPFATAEWCLVSAKTGEGLSLLKARVLDLAGLHAQECQAQAFLNNARHLAALESALESLARARGALEGRLPAECSAADLLQAARALEALLGTVSTDDVLEKLFSSFCVGK